MTGPLSDAMFKCAIAQHFSGGGGGDLLNLGWVGGGAWYLTAVLGGI